MLLKHFRLSVMLSLLLCFLVSCTTLLPTKDVLSKDVLFLLGGCCPDFLVGDWQAKWVFSDSTSLNLGEGLRYQMDGHFSFSKYGYLKLDAYGCPNCILSRDTIIAHELQWSYLSDQLQLRAAKHPMQSDQVQLTYQLQRRTDDTLYFVLMEEVELRLWRAQKP